jgi:hypothetical protein
LSSEADKRQEEDEILATIKEMQNGFIKKKQLLVESEQRLEILASEIGDERGKQLADEMSNFAIVLQNVYEQIEALWIGGLTGREQVEMLKEAILSVPEVANNSEVMSGIERAFKEYEQKYGNLRLSSETS